MKEWYFNTEDYKELKNIPKIKNKKIKSFVGIKFLLPFHLPINEDSKLIINYREIDYAIIIKQHNIKRNLLDEMSIDDSITEVEITIFNRIRLSTGENDVENNKVISLALKFLNHFIKSMKVEYNFQGLRILSRQDLPQMLPVRFYTTPSFKEKHIKDFGILNMHFKNIPPYQDEIQGKEVDILAEAVAQKEYNPYFNSIYYVKRANDLIQDGEYQFGVLSLQTGIEMFMYTLYKEILEYNNFSEKDIESKVQAGYKNILKNPLKKSFEEQGYIFSFNREENEKNLLFGYYEKVYILRNKIIHEGYYCSEEEATTAGEIGLEVIGKIVKAINDSDLQKSAFRGETLLY